MTAKAIKTGKVAIETVSIWCPDCCDFVEGPISGSSLLDLEEYSKLPHTITCRSCGEKFKKPAVSSFKTQQMRGVA